MSDDQKKEDLNTALKPEADPAKSGEEQENSQQADGSCQVEQAKGEHTIAKNRPHSNSKKKSFFKRHKYLCCISCGIVILLASFLIFLGPILHFCIEKFAPSAIGVPVTIGDLEIKLFRGQINLSKVKIGDSKGLNADHFVELERIDVDLFEGCVDIRDVLISNPEGYHKKHIFTLKKAHLNLETDSLSKEKLIIEELTVTGLDLYYEPKFRGKNNIEALQEYIKEIFPSSSDGKKDTDGEAKKLQIDKLNLSEIRLHTVIMEKTLTLPMIPIELEDLGTGPEGITGGEVASAVLEKLSNDAIETINRHLKAMGIGVGEFLDEMGTKSMDFLNETGEKILNVKDWF